MDGDFFVVVSFLLNKRTVQMMIEASEQTAHNGFCIYEIP